MKCRIGSHTEIGVTGERYYPEEDSHFALLGLGWNWCRKSYAYLSIYFLVWRVELYVDYEPVENKWEHDYLDDLDEVASKVDNVFNNMREV
jgi:hypothetical protein